MSPITPGVEVTEIKTLLLAKGDICRGPRNFTSDEGPSSSRALVVKQDTVAGIHPIGLPVVDSDPVCVEFGDTVGRTWVEWSSLGLRSLNDLPVQLRGRGLVETDVLLESTRTDRVKKTESTETIDVARVFGHLERDLDVRLSTEIVDFSGLDLGNDVHKVCAIAQIAIVKLELVRPWLSSIGDCELVQRLQDIDGNVLSCWSAYRCCNLLVLKLDERRMTPWTS